MNSIGRKFRVTIFGESHGIEVGAVIDGTPAGIPLAEADFAEDMGRRKSGAKGTTSRKESDEPRIVSGVFNGHTTGAPITILFTNSNIRSEDYANLSLHPRPGHSDFVAYKKFGGYNDYRGGGHFSGRITLGLVAAGVIAKKIVDTISIKAEILKLGGDVTEAMAAKDSIGGVVECRAKGMPVGLGEPFFDSVESLIAHAAFSIPAVKGIEFGTGFASAMMRGSELNDRIIDAEGTTATNHAGGVNGGISNGNPLVFRVAVKPTSSIAVPQETLNVQSGQVETLVVKGRHDACIALRVPVILEAITAIVLADLSLLK